MTFFMACAALYVIVRKCWKHSQKYNDQLPTMGGIGSTFIHWQRVISWRGQISGICVVSDDHPSAGTQRPLESYLFKTIFYKVKSFVSKSGEDLCHSSLNPHPRCINSSRHHEASVAILSSYYLLHPHVGFFLPELELSTTLPHGIQPAITTF